MNEKVTVYIDTAKWNRGATGGWGDGQTGCANTFIQKAHGVMAHFGNHASRLDPTVTSEVIRINDNKETPDSYKKVALQTLLTPYKIDLVFVDPPAAETPVTVSVKSSESDNDSMAAV